METTPFNLTKKAITIVTLTYNSERTLDLVLNSVANWADELLVIDSGSTDLTEQIAKKYNAKFVYNKFEGFGKQKQKGVELAKNDWVFIVDSDEVVTPELSQEIIQHVPSEKFAGFMVPNTLVFLEKEMRYGREYKQPHLRLFNKKKGKYNDNNLHENVILEGEIYTFKNHVLHYSYADISALFTKLNTYTSVAATDMKKRNKKITILSASIKSCAGFVIEYFVRLNFLNGYRGFIWSACHGIYKFVKYIKLKELNTHNY